MRSRFPQSPVIHSLVVAIACSIFASIVVARYLGPQQHPAGTETSWITDDDGYRVQVDHTYDDKGRLTERKEYDRNGKLRKRITYTYLAGFREPNTSITYYRPDGKTPEKTTNLDSDKDGNLTSTVTTNYDEKGTETGGTKREHDPKTGKDRCYKWDPKKQEYEEVPCPPETAQSSSQPPTKSSSGAKVNITDRDTRNNTCTCGGSNTPCPCPSPSPTPSSGNSQNARVETGRGLQTVIFDVPQGQFHVYLPDDMRAGDTISGTVVAEPKGNSPEDKEKNKSVLAELTIDVGGKAITAKQQRFTIQPQFEMVSNALPGGEIQTIFITIRNANQNYDSRVRGNQPLARAVITPYLQITGLTQNTSDSKIIAPFQIPALGQQGRPIEIIGPFDGNSSNTSLNWTAVRSAVQAFEKNTENVSGGFGLLAESPRKAVFTAPTNVTGPIELHLKEGNVETKSNYRNIGVNLSAPKTSLIRGESTTLTIEVSGLQGIKEPVPLHLVKGGVVTMQGGDVQTMSIKPAEVQTNGTFTTTRTITGVQTGVWSATATVVVFKYCLQDDNNGNSIIFSSETGDYIFCQGPSAIAGANPISLSTIDFSGGVLVQAGDIYDATTNGRMFNLEQSTPDRRVLIQLSGGGSPTSGSATIQTTNPKRTFTITDRNTRDNTCTCK